MKKNYILVFTLVFILALTGCNKGRIITGDTTPTEESEKKIITVTAGGNSIRPYQHFLYSGQWDGEHFVCIDGVSLTMELSRLVKENLLPQLKYDEDLKVVTESDVELGYIALYDSNYNELEMLQNVSELSELDKGDYYVGIAVNKEGQYIEEAKAMAQSQFTETNNVRDNMKLISDQTIELVEYSKQQDR